MDWVTEYDIAERRYWRTTKGPSMSTITVAFVNEPRKEGSKWSSVKTTDNKYLSFDNTKLSFIKGKSYEVETTSKDVNGTTYYTITSAKEKSGVGADGASGDRWWMPFVSNTVAHAIAAAQITDPLQIKTWAAAAKQAALEIEKSSAPAREPGEDDDQPF